VRACVPGLGLAALARAASNGLRLPPQAQGSLLDAARRQVHWQGGAVGISLLEKRGEDLGCLGLGDGACRLVGPCIGLGVCASTLTGPRKRSAANGGMTEIEWSNWNGALVMFTMKSKRLALFRCRDGKGRRTREKERGGREALEEVRGLPHTSGGMSE